MEMVCGDRYEGYIHYYYFIIIENGKMELNMVEAFMNIAMEMLMKDILQKVKERVSAFIHGLIKVIIKGIGKEIKCMAREYLFIQMARLLKEYLKMIKLLNKQ